MQNKLCEIFRAGEHTDSKGRIRLFTIDDLDKIITNFCEQNPDVPICIGHPEQKAPAYGWVNSLKRIGNKLYCDFKQVQESFKDAVNQGLFKTRSISINPKTMQLRHIAFLGAQAPAIKGMEEFCFTQDDTENLFEYCEDINKEGEEMPRDDEQQANYSEELAQKDSKIKELEQKVEEMVKEKRQSEFSEITDKWVEKGNILPKHKEQVMNILQACHEYGDFNFSEGGDKPAIDCVKEFFESMKAMNFEEIGNEKNADISKSTDFSDFNAEQWEDAINSEIKKAADKGETITSKEALRRITK